jgi:hypothetical protein
VGKSQGVVGNFSANGGFRWKIWGEMRRNGREPPSIERQLTARSLLFECLDRSKDRRRKSFAIQVADFHVAEAGAALSLVASDTLIAAFELAIDAVHGADMGLVFHGTHGWFEARRIQSHCGAEFVNVLDIGVGDKVFVAADGCFNRNQDRLVFKGTVAEFRAPAGHASDQHIFTVDFLLHEGSFEALSFTLVAAEDSHAAYGDSGEVRVEAAVGWSDGNVSQNSFAVDVDFADDFKLAALFDLLASFNWRAGQGAGADKKRDAESCKT